MPDQLWWYTARAAGLVSWALLAAGILWGLSLSTKVLRGTPRPNWQLDLHRFLGGTSVVFVAVHGAALLLDSYVDFGPTDLLVPFAASWNPIAVAWGVAALYLLVAVEVTSLLRARIPKRLWRLTHLLSFPLFAAGTVHLLTAGTDRHNRILLGVVVLTSALIAGLTVIRIVQATAPPGARRRTARPQPTPPASIDLTVSPPRPEGVRHDLPVA